MTMKVHKGLEFLVVARLGGDICLRRVKMKLKPRECFMWPPLG